MIDGQEVVVIFDTGAPGLVLNSNYYAGDEEQTIPCSGVNGAFECKTHLIREWNWLGTKHRKTTALVSDLTFLENALHKKIYALIGLQAVENYFITIDYDHASISLDEKLDFDKQHAIRFQYADHLPVINCTVNQEKKMLGLDTGAGSNYLFAPIANLSENQLTSSVSYFVTGTENKQKTMQSIQMDVQLETENFSSPFLLSTFPTSSNILSIDGLLGVPFLANYVVTIHPTKQLIILQQREFDRVMPLAVNP